MPIYGGRLLPLRHSDFKESRMKLAFIGLGVMGYPMAGHLQAAGHDVCVYNRTSSPFKSMKVSFFTFKRVSCQPRSGLVKLTVMLLYWVLMSVKL